jgi:catechol 2,3-dioxygenase-like lactoylglutathione lyase family enzyme
MLTRVDLTMDCSDAERLAEFWKTAAGYVDEPPPAPFATRAEWVASFDEDEDDGMGGAWLHDPTGVAPRLCLLQVPEPKTAKNRLHLDLRVSGNGTPDEKWSRVVDEVERLRAAGARVLHTFEGRHVVMADPEGNEFCVA